MGAEGTVGIGLAKSSDRSFSCVLMHLAASHEATGDLGGLMTRAGRRGMGREVTRSGDEDRRNLWVALPAEALPHGGLQVLYHVEASILAQHRVTQNRNEIGASDRRSVMPTTERLHSCSDTR
jgi:hypothetical protein